jgi:hypothetical protein
MNDDEGNMESNRGEERRGRGEERERRGEGESSACAWPLDRGGGRNANAAGKGNNGTAHGISDGIFIGIFVGIENEFEFHLGP